jgi:hypothetical protein
MCSNQTAYKVSIFSTCPKLHHGTIQSAKSFPHVSASSTTSYHAAKMITFSTIFFSAVRSTIYTTNISHEPKAIDATFALSDKSAAPENIVTAFATTIA